MTRVIATILETMCSVLDRTPIVRRYYHCQLATLAFRIEGQRP